jgi:tetratricopeptide (TPR) repeat protein
MKKLNRILIITIVTFLAFSPAFAQDFNDLMKQGIGLHNAGKYDEAIAKYNQALKLVPDNASANYEIAFSLYSAKRPKEAIPYLEKASKDNRMTVPADALLASIYDEDNQSDKAIATYQEAIKIDPTYPQIYYNLGIAYFRAKKYT